METKKPRSFRGCRVRWQFHKELAAEAGVGEHTYDAGKAILDAVADGQLLPNIVEDIRNGTESIHGAAKNVKAKPARKAKSAVWQTAVKAFAQVVRRFIKRDPSHKSEIAASLRAIADEVIADEIEQNDQAVAA